MPDVLLIESGDRLLQESGAAFVLESRARGTRTVPRVAIGAAVSPIRSAGAAVTPHVSRAPLVSPELGIGT
jgi:hypothetical protein